MINMIKQYKNRITFLSGALIVLGIVFSILEYTVIKNIFMITATVIAGIPIMITAFQSLRLRMFSIELLVTIAVIGAIFIKEYTESSVVTFLFLFGAYLEARTLEKTRSSLKLLMDMAPKEATVIRNGGTVNVPVEDVSIGDHVIIKSGGKVPIDGMIIAGQGYLNESTITGESMPKLKTDGDKVLSGTILDNGYIEILTEKIGSDTTFSKIIELVDEAQGSKSKVEKILDKFSNKYTPTVIILSVLVFLITRNMHLAITFLVIACPGALVIGAPVSNVAGIGNGAKNGVLIKGGEIIDRLSKIDTVVFDKTGTVTKGKPEVVDVKAFLDYKDDGVLAIAATVEKSSEHHLGRAIVNEANRRDLFSSEKVENFKVIKAHGVSANVKNHEIIIGNKKLLRSENIKLSKEAIAYGEKSEKLGYTAIYIAKDQELIGIVSLADKVRDDAKVAIQELRKNGVKNIIMLTGDNKFTAEKVANYLEMDNYYAELLPEEKVEHVQRLRDKGFKTAMVGDGINDAPAIATADIGLAMGDGGTDISIETADVVLMADKLIQFSHAYALSKATIRNMRQNIIIALGTVVVLLGGVLFNYIHLASGMFIHEASVLIVILNAMRLIKFRPHKNNIQKENESSVQIIDTHQAS